jgi:hypothetical protein
MAGSSGCIFLVKGYDWSEGSVYSYLLRGCYWYCGAVYSFGGAVIGRNVRFVPIEGLLLVKRCGIIFLLKGKSSCLKTLNPKPWLEGAVYSYGGDMIGCVFLLKGCDWSDNEVYSYWGAAVGLKVRLYIPIEGLRLVGRCGIFLLRGCYWLEGAVYSY